MIINAKNFMRMMRTTFGRSRVRFKDFIKIKNFYRDERINSYKENSNNISALIKYGFIEGKNNFPFSMIKKRILSTIPNSHSHKIWELSQKNKDICLKLFDENFRKVCEKYFDSDVVVHNLNIVNAVSKKSSELASDTWHYDLAGNRLKIFIVLSVENCGVSTEFILESNREKRLPAFIFSRLSVNKAMKKFGNKLKSHSGKEDTWYIFDTNMWHRGGFSNADDSKIGKRITLQYDVVTKDKYEFFKKLDFPSVGFDNNVIH